MTPLSKTLLHTTDTYIKKLHEGGIVTVEDLIGHYPRAYKDKSEVLEFFSYVNIQEPNTLRVTIETITSERTRNKKDLIKAVLRDKGGFLSEAVWFNRKFLMQKFRAGDTVIIHGKPKYEYGRLSFPSADIDLAKEVGSTIVPVYPDCNYIPGSWFEGKLLYVKEYFKTIPEAIPEEIRKAKGFRRKYENLLAIHFPSSKADFERAREELAYEELFSLQYAGLLRKKASEEATKDRAVAIPLNAELVKDILAKLPFPLTNNQKIVLFQILKDMERGYSMQRLLQGDVGTGKTVVALVAAIHAILESGKMSSLNPLVQSPHSRSPHPSPLPEGEGEIRKENAPKYVIDLARKGRMGQTSAEEFLWEILRDRQLDDLKFRRQHPIRRYIADFFCDELWLVVELDGKIHENQKEYDAIRNEFMKAWGYKIMRVTNDEIFNNTESVLNKILQYKNSPLPLGEGLGVRALDEGSGVRATWTIQVALLAPTEILARQHFASVGKLLGTFGITSDLLVGSLTAKQKEAAKERLKRGEVSVIIGTHALLEEDVHFRRLGFTIIDEQHRFGVEQRKVLEQYASVADGIFPHNLNMTATPIPRTLALTIYGDQDISVLSEYPVGRKPIITRVTQEWQRSEVYNFIAEEVKSGRQVYWISPLVEESESLDIASAVNTQEVLRSVFPTLRIGLLHGKMKGKEKDAIMREFYERKIDILSSTSVVEVGVDNPNASVICIEAAERFGLSQLHQFRGRVGRGDDQSYCFLFTTKSYTGERLRAMEKSNDGFYLAETDLELRGPGEVYGVRQSGLPEFKIADLKDLELVSEIRADIEGWMKQT